MSKSVLLVEDDADARASLARSLTREGYGVVTAESVDTALEAARAATFLDAVVTDVVLGPDEEGGVRLIGALRVAGVRAPIVLITAFAALDNVKRGLNEGASFMLEKPFRAAELIEVLRRVTAEPRDIGYLVDRALRDAGLTPKSRASRGSSSKA